MTNRKTHRAGLALGWMLALGLASAACQKTTYLEVDFVGAGLPALNRIDVTMTLTRPDGGVAQVSDSLPQNAPAGANVTLPASVVFKLDGESGSIHVAADAVDLTGATVGHVEGDTTIMSNHTWKLLLDFGGPDGGGANDGGVVDGGDGGGDDGGDDGGLVVITDGSVADDAAGCVAATVVATETVSLNYSKMGSNTDAGATVPDDILSASVAPQKRFIGWMKFGLRFIPKNFTVMSATVNLILSDASGPVPKLVVEYSKVDGWTRQTTDSSEVTDDGTISAEFDATPQAAPAVNAYSLDVTNHDWSSDVTDGTITVGIDNDLSVSSTAMASQIEFFGFDHTMPRSPNRPSLALVFCR
jgi:hypothetical protein